MKFVLFTVAALSASPAFARTLTVDFQYCSSGGNEICANVYGQGGRQNMRVRLNNDASGDRVERDILRAMGSRGQSLAMNIDGEIQSSSNSFGGSRESVLMVYSAESSDANAPRPRGF